MSRYKPDKYALGDIVWHEYEGRAIPYEVVALPGFMDPYDVYMCKTKADIRPSMQCIFLREAMIEATEKECLENNIKEYERRVMYAEKTIDELKVRNDCYNDHIKTLKQQLEELNAKENA